MKEQIFGIIRSSKSPALAGNLVREYLQARILLALQEAGAMIPLAFHGGTALRFLFGLPRFSEDLDFALERPGREGFDLAAYDGRRVRVRGWLKSLNGPMIEVTHPEQIEVLEE